ncbi:MAG: C2 family cysteine protease [Candidatus Sericytochromatia bacterium]
MSSISSGINKPDQFSLKKGVSEVQFTKKLDEVLVDKKLTKSEFKELASNLVGGQKALKDILGRVLPPKDVKDMLAGIGSLGSKSIKLDDIDKREIVKMIKTEILKDSDGVLRVPKNANIENIKNPAIRGALQSDITINGVDFKKDEKCLVIEKGDKKFIQKLDVNAKGEATKPKGDPIEINDDTFSKITKEQTFKKTDEPLFPDGKVSPRDVKQGSIGNCYAIAAIYSIAQKDPDAIKRMIKDNGDGTVTVRLFDKDGNGKISPKYIKMEKSTLETKEHAQDSLWVQMLEKAYASHKGSYQLIGQGGWSKDPLTVFLGKEFKKSELDGNTLEKTILKDLTPNIKPNKQYVDALKNSVKEWCKSLELPIPSDEKLNGLDKLVDKDTKSSEIIKTLQQDFNFDYDKGVALVNHYFPSTQLSSLKDMIKDLGEYPVPKFDAGKMGQLKDTMKSWFSQLNMPAPTKEQLGGLDKFVGKDLKQVDLVNKIKTFGLDQTNSDALVKAFFPEKTFNPDDILKSGIDKKQFDTLLKGLKEKYPISNANKDKNALINKLELAGKNIYKNDDMNMKTDLKINYKPEELKVFSDIQDALKKGKFVCIDTKVNIGVSSGSGHSGGEPIVDGLAGQHAYAVLDTVQMGGRMFVKIANPWGNDFSRDYTVQQDGSLKSKKYDKNDYSYLKPSEPNSTESKTHDNESWIELNNLTSDFNAIHIAS